MIARWLLALFLTVAAPMALVVGYIEIGENGFEFAIPWYLACVIVLVPGIVGIHLLPIASVTKGILTACYVPACLFGSFFFALAYVCGVHGRCL